LEQGVQDGRLFVKQASSEEKQGDMIASEESKEPVGGTTQEADSLITRE
jgi:hypothetical protein